MSPPQIVAAVASNSNYDLRRLSISRFRLLRHATSHFLLLTFYFLYSTSSFNVRIILQVSEIGHLQELL